MFPSSLPYDALLAEARSSSLPLAEYLRRELPYLWQEAYLKMTPRPTNIAIITHGTFDYVYDDYATLEATGVVETDNVTEARLVGAVGVSQPNPSLRKLLLESCNLHTVLDWPSGTFQGAGVKTVVLFFEKGAPTRRTWFYQVDQL
jgi:hypothetical protein